MKRLSINNMSGVSLVEASVTFFVFLFVIFFFIDLSRFFYTYTIYNQAANLAANLAGKLELEQDIDDAHCGSLANATECQRYAHRVNKVLERGMELIDSASLGGVKHIGIKNYDYLSNFVLKENEEFHSGAFLRPGERAIDEENQEINHPTRPYCDSASQIYCTKQDYPAWPTGEESWQEVLDQHPVEVVYRAEVKFFTPLLSSWEVVGKGFAYRRSKSFGKPLVPATTTSSSATTSSTSATSSTTATASTTATVSSTSSTSSTTSTTSTTSTVYTTSSTSTRSDFCDCGSCYYKSGCYQYENDSPACDACCLSNCYGD